jgi:chromosome segregation protein
MNDTLRLVELSDQGSHFYRTDLQVHTPRDNAWSGRHPVSPGERMDYARTFVAACRQKGLHAVAITDHHDLLFAPLIRTAAEQEVDDAGSPVPKRSRLVVFPGVELTLALARQALLILDADFPDSQLAQVLHTLAIDPCGDENAALPSVEPLDHIQSLADLHRRFDEQPWLKGRYIILPNVTDKGHKTILRKGMQAEYKDMPCVGGYLDGSVEKIGDGNRRILTGQDSSWGNKRIAVFQTSDSRTGSFEELGKFSTWVKWVRPTAEALRQACLAQESRLCQGDPSLPNVWIRRVVVSASKFMGHVDVAMNPQYTALIGGRGTGKSTMLDYMRWALCDQPAQATEDDEVADPRVRQRKLVAATLEPLHAVVEVEFVINGITHVVRRQAVDGGVQLKVADGPFEKAREGAIQSLLAIQAYSQKQLSSVAIRIEELLRFVIAPIKSRLEEIDRDVQEIAGRLRENYGTLQRYRQLSRDIERSDLSVRSLTEQGQALRDALTGISDDDRRILDAKADYDEMDGAQSRWLQQTASVIAALRATSESLQRSLDGLVLPTRVPLDMVSDAEALLSATRALLLGGQSQLGAIESEITTQLARGGSLESLTEQVRRGLAAYADAYTQVKERSSVHDSKLVELGNLEKQERSGRELLQRQQQELGDLGNPMSRHRELRVELSSKRRERSDALAAECAALAVASQGLISAQLSIGRGLDQARTKFKALISGSNVRATKIDALFEELQNDSDPTATWGRALEELEKLMLLEPDADIRSELTPTLSRLGLGIADQKRLISRLTPDGWLDLSLTPLSDHPDFQYQSKEQSYIPFSSASAGQQASALLTTLLSQGGTPLIIDQPEDDLDSDTVQEIVSRIWDAKSRRQLIFASHNANLVVNGDADLVLVCAYLHAGDQSAGHIEKQGAIDVPDICNEITQVMEGGERAFRLRKEKYGF